MPSYTHIVPRIGAKDSGAAAAQLFTPNSVTGGNTQLNICKQGSHDTCRFLRVIIVSTFRDEANAQKKKIGIHNDLAVLVAELCQNLTGAPSNALLVDLFLGAAPYKKKTNVWARLRGQQEQLTIQVR